jgi:fructokinase
LNVAYQLSTLGHDVRLISRVGQDEFGRAAVEKIGYLGLPQHTIQYDPKYQTGKVLVHINDANEPSFDILSPAAWDFINPPENERSSGEPFHLVLGTLAQRSKVSLATIRSLLPAADTVFYDVNLRPPHTPAQHVLESLVHADVGKMNKEELTEITRWASLPSGSLKEMARAIFTTFNLEVLAVTLGSAGALLVCREGIFTHAGFPVQVADTVGAGDAFFAGLIDGILKKSAWQECLAQANQRGAYVASRAGATPDMSTFQKLLKAEDKT